MNCPITYSHLRHYRYAFAVCVSMLFLCSKAFAACPYPGVPVNQIYKYDPKPIEDAIKAGLDPCPEWIERGGFTGSPTQAGQKIVTSIVPAHRPALKYKNKGCNEYNEPDTKAGGKFDGGATDACQKGKGSGLFAVNVPDVGIPKVEQEEVECLGSLFSGIFGMLSGTGAGITVGDGDIKATGRVGNGCISGSIGICGIGSIGGSFCPDGGDGEKEVKGYGSPPLSRSDPAKYVELGEIVQFDYGRTPINEVSTIYCPEGCRVTYAKGLPEQRIHIVKKGDYVTMSADGNVFTSAWQLRDYKSDDPIELLPVDTSVETGVADPLSYVTIRPNRGILRIDDNLFKGDTIDGKGTAVFTDTDKATYVPNGEDVGEVTFREEETGGAIAPDEIDGVPTAGAFEPENLEVPIERPDVTVGPATPQS